MNTLERLLAVFCRVFDGEVDTATITPESRLQDDIGINSIGMLYMAMALEDEFGIQFRNEDFYTIRTVRDVLDCIDRKATPACQDR